MEKKIKRISFFEDLGNKRATISYFMQEGPRTCNASCVGCYAGAGMVSFNLSRRIVPFEEAYKDISELVKEYRVLIRGTEVILDPRNIALLKLADNKIVLTNGLVLGKSQKHLDLLADNDVSNIVITYPFSSTPATNRSLIDLLHKKEVVNLGVQRIKQHRYPFVLQLSARITNDCRDLDAVCVEAISIGADVLRFIPEVAMSGDPEIDKYAYSKQEREKLVQDITELKIKYKGKLFIHTPGDLGLFPLRAEKKKELNPKSDIHEDCLICPAGIYYFAIGAVQKSDKQGKLYRPVSPCHFRMDAEIGKYYGGSELEIDKQMVCELFANADRTDCPAQNYWFNHKEL